MANYELGKIGLNIRGEYSEHADYEMLDVVSYNGSSYVALAACTGVNPADATKWMQLAQGMGMEEMELSFDDDAKFKANGLQPAIRVFGKMVEFQGEIVPTSSISGSTTYYSICTIPLEYAPPHDVITLQQGSNQQIWMLRIFNRNHETHAGKVMFARCRSGSSWSSVGTSTWLPFHASWLI